MMLYRLKISDVLHAQEGGNGGAQDATRTVPRSAADSGTGEHPLHEDVENERGPITTPAAEIPLPDDININSGASDGKDSHGAGGPAGAMGA